MKRFYFSKEMYQSVTRICQYYLPAAGTLYFTLAGIWGLPCAEQIVGTIVAVDTFLGVILGYSTKNYKDEMKEGEE